MKLQQLFESTEIAGYYSTFPIDGGSAEDVKYVLSAHDIKDVYAKEYNDLGVRCVIISHNFESLENFLKVAQSKVKVNPKIHYTSGEEPLRDFNNFPKIIKTDILFEDNCKFTSFKGVDKHFSEIHGKVYFNALKIKSNVLGLLRINGVTEISVGADYRKQHGWKLEEILNKHLNGGDIMDCQDELIDAGFEEYAKL